MAKRKSSKTGTFDNPTDPTKIYAAQSAYLSGMIAERKKKTGSAWIGTGGDLMNTTIGIRCPLLLQIMLQSSCLPLERLMHIVGVEGTFKSAFGFEIGRFYCNAGGYMNLIEHESKFSPTFCSSIIGYEDEAKRLLCVVEKAKSQEEWQEALTVGLKQLKKYMLSAGGPGVTYPVLFNVDSLMGKLSNASKDKIATDGFASRQFALEAMLITNYLRSQSDAFTEWPVSFLAINHVKPQPAATPYMEPVRNKAGGRQIAIQETFEIQVDKGKKLTLTEDAANPSLSGGGQNVKMKCYKNSLGETGRSIEVPVRWQYLASPIDGTPRQYTTWHWEEGLVNFLLTSHSAGTEVQKAKLDGVCNIRPSTAGRVYATSLGISSKSPVSKEELGKIIEKDRDLLNAYRRLFAIHSWAAFRPGVDYREQLRRVRERACRGRESEISKLSGKGKESATKVRSSGGSKRVPGKAGTARRVRTQATKPATNEKREE